MDNWTDSFFLLIPYLFAAGAVTGIYLALQRRREKAALAQQAESIAQGLNEPPSLHPVIDPHRCIGSAGCVPACPEGALGIVQGKAVLVNAASCIGHGACKPACPVDAIQLVFGTEKRGVDIPELTPQFETNIPGLFIAGELGGMGLIRKAVEQGRQAMDVIRGRVAGGGAGGPDELDVLIVGAGPAGLAAGLGALQHKLRYRLIEQEDSLGGAVYHYPRNKIAMTAPVQLPIIGKVKMGEIQKEKLLEFWSGVVAKTGLTVSYRERMESLQAQPGGGFAVTTNHGTLRARTVLLAIGRRGTPRKLEVPGEEAAKVVYKLVDAEQYRGQQVLVVGGGDSALEAAVALSEQPGTTVTLSYRSEAFSRVKQKNRDRVQAQAAAGRLQLALSSTVKSIAADAVVLKTAQGEQRLPNDAVVVCAGGVLPTPLLQAAGVRFATKHGTA